MRADADPLRPILDRLLVDAGDGDVVDDVARDRLVAFVRLLQRWNRVWNLTAVREPRAMLERHVLDSLALLPPLERALDDAPAAEVDLLDIGSGAGLPVLPLAIVRPELVCLSVERTTKKARFQRQAAIDLGLERVTVRDERIEAVAVRARVVTSRAFAAPADFLALAATRIAPGGRALVMLGRAERLPSRLPPPFELADVVRTSREPERHVAVCTATGAPT